MADLMQIFYFLLNYRRWSISSFINSLLCAFIYLRIERIQLVFLDWGGFWILLFEVGPRRMKLVRPTYALNIFVILADFFLLISLFPLYKTPYTARVEYFSITKIIACISRIVLFVRLIMAENFHFTYFALQIFSMIFWSVN